MTELLRARPKLHGDVALEHVSGRLMAAGRSDLLHIFEDVDGTRSEVGERIVELCDGIRSVEQIIDVVVEEFEGAEPEQVSADVQAFIQKLVALEILER